MTLHILLGILGLSVLVIIHESGHYLVARAFKMRVLRFSIGFGPAIVSYRPKGSDTIFQIGAVPLLAYVQIAGMNPAENLEPGDSGNYAARKPWQRFLTVAAGPFFNYVAAVVILFAAGLMGWPSVPKDLRIDPPVGGTPAARAGLRLGDRIVAVEGRSVRTWTDVIAATSPRTGRPTRYSVVRRGHRVEYTITPRLMDGEPRVGRIGIRPMRQYVSLPPLEAAKTALVMPAIITVEQLGAIGQLIRRRTTEGMMGPVGMVSELAQGAREPFSVLLLTLAGLSVGLGLINMLPFPALDGGRIVFIAYEMVIRRRVNERVEAVVHMVGIFVLLAFLVFLTVKDVGRL